MRKIRYVIPTREKFLYILTFLLPLSFMYLFSFDMRFNLKYEILYTYRYVLYIFCFILSFWKFFSHIIIHKFILVFSLDEEKFKISIPFRRKKGYIAFDAITKLIIRNDNIIRLFFVKKNDATTNTDVDNSDINKENIVEDIPGVNKDIVEDIPDDNKDIVDADNPDINKDNINEDKENNEVSFIIPLKIKNGGIIHKEDFFYIMNIFKDIEIEYDKVTHDEIFNMISKKQIYKHRIIGIFAYIACIGFLFALLFNLFFIFLFILSKIY